MVEKINPIRETDDEALKLAESLINKERYAALAVTEPETAAPIVSRIACAFAKPFGLFFTASDLSHHSKCLLQNATCSLLLGEPGKGDGLAHPRITLIGGAKRMPNEHEKRDEFRSAYLKIHPKAALYIDFLDFGFYPFELDRAYLNGGFGKAYHLTKDELHAIMN